MSQTLAELASGRASLASGFGPRFRPVLVPPWNRIDPLVVARLPEAGFAGLSTFGPRAAVHPVPGLVQCNTHVDLIAWRRDRAFIGVDAAIDRLVLHLESRRAGVGDPAEPTGILTHHLDLDAPAWRFSPTSSRARAITALRRGSMSMPCPVAARHFSPISMKRT